jgi:hypothetical protein
MNTRNHRMILFPFAGAILGALAGAGFGMDKGMAASAAFFGFVGFGLGYALHDFNWRCNRKTTIALVLAFMVPLAALVALVASQGFEKVVLTPESLFGIAGVLLAPGGLLALIVYAVANTFGLIDEVLDWPAGGVPSGGVMEDEEQFPSSIGGPYGYGYSANGFANFDDD